MKDLYFKQFQKYRLVISATVLMISLLFSQSGCKQGKKNNLNKNSEPQISSDIIVTVPAQKFIIENILPEIKDQVVVLIPAGNNHETFELSAKTLKEISNSKIYFTIGALGFEKTWGQKIIDNNKHIEIIKWADNSRLISNEQHTHQHSHNHNHHHDIHQHTDEFDPHIWLSTESLLTGASVVESFLTNLYPGKKELIKKNTNQLTLKINHLRDSLSKELKPYAGKKILIFHPSLGYYVKQFNLKQVALENEGKEPIINQLKLIIDEGNTMDSKGEKNHDYFPVVLIQKEFDKEKIKLIASELSWPVEEINPMNDNPLNEMENITKILTKSLKNN